ncbi:MAG: heme-copper oxidase subunit III [Actinobacteria bacterium]|nr:heme-copper oxidase subunit III [Actinomycetota bacterium]MCL5447161.1 heme-copper oxidase subunit III [Actinomycetota bacterium]
MAQTMTFEPVPLDGNGARRKFERPSLLGVGILIWLGSEMMFFSGLFAAYFTIRAHAAVWPPPGTKLDLVQASIFTVVLLVSSPTMQKAVWEIEKGNRTKARRWVVISFILGLAFVINQGVEWVTLTTRASTNAYGSLFFLMTGLHGLHVLLGLVAMLFLLVRMRGASGDPGELSVFQGVSYYWHFVDIMWIGLFSCLFLLKTG